MTRSILITGATGNVGTAVLRALSEIGTHYKVYAGVHKQDAFEKVSHYPNLSLTPVLFDFTDQKTVEEALAQCDILFLLRPPHLSDVPKYFQPVIEKAKLHKVQHIVFLSVQGVEHSSIIPHHKIENVIKESGIPYTFLRPAYFMQNFTTTLKADLIQKNEIYLPAGDAKFTLVDLEDVGEVAARVLQHPEKFKNCALTLTNNERLSFSEMAAILSTTLHRPIKFKNANPFGFYLTKRRHGFNRSFVLVMIALHFLPRIQAPLSTTTTVADVTDEQPNSFAEFARNNAKALAPVNHVKIISRKSR